MRQLAHATKEKIPSRKQIVEVLTAGSPSKAKSRKTVEVSDDSTFYPETELAVVALQPAKSNDCVELKFLGAWKRLDNSQA